MKRLAIGAAALLALSPQAASAQLSDAEIRQRIVEQSVANYRRTRPCACPYNRMRNGNRCGGRSAYSRPGGASPLCYPDDVSPREVEAYRRRGT